MLARADLPMLGGADTDPPVYAPVRALVQTTPMDTTQTSARCWCSASRRAATRRRRPSARAGRGWAHPVQRRAGAVEAAPPLRRRGAGDRRARACGVSRRDRSRGFARGRFPWRHLLMAARRRAGTDWRPAGRGRDRQSGGAGAQAATGCRQSPGSSRAHRRPHGRLATAYLLRCWSPAGTPSSWSHAVGRYRRLGTTIDDALGEAFDKTAKLLGLGFPGGPAVSRAAPPVARDRFALPRPMLGRPEPHFSFAGLKTAVRHQAQALFPSASRT